MPQYLVTNYLPDNFDPSTMTEATIQSINDLNEELIAAGARLMAAGLAPASQAKALRSGPNGELLITDGPYMEAKEHVGGFWILEAADMEEALGWARKAAMGGAVQGEVREIPIQQPAEWHTSSIAGQEVSTPPAKLEHGDSSRIFKRKKILT